jgi:integrase/recombinase XerD
MNLATLINQYITYRKSLGESFITNEKNLNNFCRTIGGEMNIKDISEKIINEFLYKGSEITSAWFGKHATLLGFYRYVISRGYINKSPLPKFMPKKPTPFVPYIYSNEEIRLILKVSLTYQEAKSHNKPIVTRMILFVIYSTGLRLNEALSLKLADIDLSRLVITIKQTKFFKSRLVPFNNQLADAMKEYLTWRQNNGYAQDIEAPLFISKHRFPISSSTMRKIFQKIRKKADIKRTDNSKYQPRIHDLRHAFAVHRITAWHQEGRDVQKLLPILSTYMGHAHISDTSVYLTMTADLLQGAGNRFEQYVIGGSNES